MGRYIVRRLLILPIVLLGLSLVIFGMVSLLDPAQRATLYIPQPPKTQAALELVIRTYGLDKPIPLQYLDWLGRTLHGDLVGPICESGDFLAQDRDLPDVREGGLLAIMSAGAYGYAMSSNYNSRRRPAEVMVDGASHVLVRRRETWEEVVRYETDGRDSGQGVEHV